MENTVKTGMEVGVGSGVENKKRLSNRRIVIVITLIASLIGAVVIGYNMYQIQAQEDAEIAMIKEAAVNEVLNSKLSKKWSFEFKDIESKLIIKELSSADLANGIKTRGSVEVIYAYRATLKNGEKTKWRDDKRVKTFLLKENGELIIDD